MQSLFLINSVLNSCFLLLMKIFSCFKKSMLFCILITTVLTRTFGDVSSKRNRVFFSSKVNLTMIPRSLKVDLLVYHLLCFSRQFCFEKKLGEAGRQELSSISLVKVTARQCITRPAGRSKKHQRASKSRWVRTLTCCANTDANNPG